MADEKPDMQALQKALDVATEIHRRNAYAVENARAEETHSLNQLNEAQKAFDAGVKAMRAAAHRDSDWKRQTGRHSA